MVERSGKSAGRGLIVARGCGVGTSCESWSCTYRDAILAVVDASAIGEDVDVGTLGSKLAVSLCKVFADVLGSGAQIVAEGTGIASLTGALTKELARYVGRVRRASGPIEAGSGCHGIGL